MKKNILLLPISILFILIGTINVKADENIITDITVNVPSAPVVGETVVDTYSIPNDVNYQLVTWNNQKMFVNGYIEDNKYQAGEDYNWSVVVCKKDGYTFASDLSDLNFTVNGVDINDNTIVKSTSKTVNAGDSCRGITIYFQTLPGTPNNFLSSPLSSQTSIVGEPLQLKFLFSSNSEIKLDKYVDSEWVNIGTINAIAGEPTSFTVPAEEEVGEISYRLNYNNKKYIQFSVNWVYDVPPITDITLNLPSFPIAGHNIIDTFSIPEGVNYQLVTWNNQKLFIYGDQTEEKYKLGEEYSWSAIVCSKEGYAFAKSIEDLNFTVNGIDITDNTIVKSTSKTTNNGVLCRGLTINFQPTKASIKDTAITGIINKTYNGLTQTQNITIKYDENILVKDEDYTVEYKNNKNAGIATIIIKGKGDYVESISKTFRINKASNPLTVKTTSKTVKYTKVKKAKQVVKPITVTKWAGTVTYKRLSGSSKLTVNTKTGKITVKKGTKKGTYKIRVKISASGNTNYKSTYRTRTITIRVK